MAEKVFMNVPAVRQIAKNFKQVGDTLENVARVMEALVNILRGTAFVGMVGGLALAQYIDSIKPHIQQMSRKCQELFSDLNKSVDAYERGDALGATRFY
jgi:uncharacterized protein YukE